MNFIIDNFAKKHREFNIFQDKTRTRFKELQSLIDNIKVIHYLENLIGFKHQDLELTRAILDKLSEIYLNSLDRDSEINVKYISYKSILAYFKSKFVNYPSYLFMSCEKSSLLNNDNLITHRNKYKQHDFFLSNIYEKNFIHLISLKNFGSNNAYDIFKYSNFFNQELIEQQIESESSLKVIGSQRVFFQILDKIKLFHKIHHTLESPTFIFKTMKSQNSTITGDYFFVREYKHDTTMVTIQLEQKSHFTIKSLLGFDKKRAKLSNDKKSYIKDNKEYLTDIIYTISKGD